MTENEAIRKIEKIVDGIQYKSVSISICTKNGKTLTLEKESIDEVKKCGF